MEDLIPEALRGYDGDFIADTLVCLEVEGELGIVSLDDNFGGLLDRLGPYATHLEWFVRKKILLSRKVQRVIAKSSVSGIRAEP